MGWLPTPAMLRTNPLRTLPGLDNFYMAGQWSMPGGGVPTVLFSGRHVIQNPAARDAGRFQTEPVS
jgi:phytoene dehydrogenase-like protein